jgi:hypothetical protein
MAAMVPTVPLAGTSRVFPPNSKIHRWRAPLLRIDNQVLGDVFNQIFIRDASLMRLPDMESLISLVS